LIKPLNMLWVDWKGNVISMWMAMWMSKRKAQPFTNAQFKSPWKRWVVKFEKTMLMTRNINSNSKSITSTNSHINNFFLLEKQNPFNERRTFCASFIIKMNNCNIHYQGSKRKTKLLLGLVNFQWHWLTWLFTSMRIRHLLNIPINFEQMTLFHHWIAITFVKSFGDGTNL